MNGNPTEGGTTPEPSLAGRPVPPEYSVLIGTTRLTAKAERTIIRLRLGLWRRWCGRDAVPNVVQLNQFVECGLGNGLHALENIPLIRSGLTGILWIEERGSALQDQFAEEGCVDEVAVGDIGVE